MMSDSEEKFLKEVETRINAILDEFKHFLDPGTVSIVFDLNSNKEPGVALEWLYDAVMDRAIKISEEQEREFHAIAKLMDIRL